MMTESLATGRERALAILRGPGPTLYGLIDAAQDPEILALIREGDCRFESLYQGESAIVMASVAPYLVELDPARGLLGTLIERGWGRNWGLYLRSRLPLAEMRRHFRLFTQVELPDGQPAYFRFYDPRVFRVFIPTCNASECRAFFQGIDSFLVEGPEGTSMLVYRLASDGRASVTAIP